MSEYPSELRRSAISGRWVMIAAGRAKRPHQFADAASNAATRDPFSPENLPKDDIVDFIPNDGTEYSVASDWKVMSIKNAFPFVAEGSSPDTSGYIRDGYGFHEIVIHSPDADKNFETFTTEQTEAVIQLYLKRFIDLAGRPHIQHVQIFTNRGHEAGASVVHPHSQIVALPVVPPFIQQLVDSAKMYHAKHGVHVVEDELERQDREAVRMIEQTEHFLAYCPYAPHTNYHIRILPKSEHRRFRDIQPDEIKDLAALLNSLMRKLNAVAGTPPYNIYIRTAPTRLIDLDGFHWHIDIQPHLAIPGGLELATGIDVITITPEDAAAELRKA